MRSTKIKVVWVLSDFDRLQMFELTMRYLNKSTFDIKVILLNKKISYFGEYLQSIGIPVENWVYHGKQDALKTTFKLLKLFLLKRPHIIHTHMIDATYTGQVAGWLAGVPVRIFTRWHANTHHREHPKGLKYDKLINRLATHIITPGNVTYRIVTKWEKVKAEKVSLLYPPYDLDAFRNPPAQEVSDLRNLYNSEGKHPVVGVISRWVDWKGIQFIIPAFKRLLEKYPDALLLLFNAHGGYEKEIRVLLKELPEGSWKAIHFERRNTGLYGIFDLFVHVPIDEYVENTGGVYTEALPSGVPSIFTLSGVVPGMVEHLRDCYISDYQSSESIYQGMITLLGDPELRKHISDNAKNAVPEDFTIKVHIKKLEALYEKAVADRL